MTKLNNNFYKHKYTLRLIKYVFYLSSPELYLSLFEELIIC